MEHADKILMDQLLEANASDEKAVGNAVVEALLPALPERLSDSFRKLALDEVQLFSALDAIRMLMHDWARIHDRAPDELTSSGEVRCDGNVVIPASTVVAAVARLAEAPLEVAEKVVAWIVEAARAMPTLIPGIESMPREDRSVNVRLVPYSVQDDLCRLWLNRNDYRVEEWD